MGTTAPICCLCPLGHLESPRYLPAGDLELEVLGSTEISASRWVLEPPPFFSRGSATLLPLNLC